MIRRCATCFGGVGDVESNWICNRCSARPENKDWVNPPHQEAGGFDMDDFESGNAIAMRPRRDPYSTKLAITIMALHCAGKSEYAIAKNIKCSPGYIHRTISYWKKARGEKLSIIRTIAKLKHRKAH